MERVMSLKELEQKLSENWDLVISNSALPDFSVVDVLNRVIGTQPDLPLILVSDSLSEQQGAELLRSGIKDFIRKDNPARLIPAVLRELREAEDRRNLRRVENVLQFNQELNRRIIESSEDLIEILSLDGNILSISPSTRKALDLIQGLTLEKSHYPELWTNDNHGQLAQRALEAARQGRTGTFRGVRSTLSGVEKWWDVIVTPIRNSAGNPDMLLAVSRDVTVEVHRQQELSDRARELREALRQAEVANKLKVEFLGNITHEIRTPVGIMLGYAEILAEPESSDAEKENALAAIRRSGDKLLRQLGEVLDYARIEAGERAIHKKSVSLRPLVENILAEMYSRNQHKKLQIEFEMGPDLPLEIGTDPECLTQILSLLMDNALKFTDRGFVRLSVSTQSMQGRSFLVFQVSDSGIGISQGDRGRLFQIFSQLDGSSTRRHTGSGLGLVIARKLARMLNGDVTLKSSQVQQGSVFEVRIENENLEQSQGAASFSPSMSSSGENLQNLRILVADDLADNRYLVGQILTKAGAVVEFSENGSEAVEKASSQSYDLILMDLQMPEMDGLWATRRIRQHGFKGPVIAVSAQALKLNVDECLHNGFNGFLVKPFMAQDLIGIILSTMTKKSPDRLLMV